MNRGPRIASGNIAVRVAHETVVWVEATGALHLLDPAATAVLDLLDGHRALEQVTALLADRFSIARRHVGVDVERLVTHMRVVNILEPVLP